MKTTSHNIIGVFALYLMCVVESGRTPAKCNQYSPNNPTLYHGRIDEIGGSVENCLGEESEDGSCGPDNDGSFCPIGSCCSKEGWCGTTEEHCNQESVCPRFDPQFYVESKGACKARYYDVVDAWVGGSSSNCNGEQQPGGKCGPHNSNGRCRPGECCSVHGFCGTSKDYCSIASQCPPKSKPGDVGGSSMNCLGEFAVDGRCGPKHHGSFCPVGACCSKEGWCGTTDKHCNKQTVCPAFNPATYVKLRGARKAQFYDVVAAWVGGSRANCNGKRQPEGKCGPNHNNGRCTDGECCSVHGYCGTSKDYCSIASRCPPKAEFGGFGGSARNCLGEPSVHGTCGPMHHGTFCPVGYCCSKYGWCGNSDEHCNEESACPPFDPAKYFELGGARKAQYFDVVKAWVGGSVENCSGKPQPDGKCGPNNNNGRCQPGECCSAYGFCGKSNDYCSIASQCPPESKIGGGSLKKQQDGKCGVSRVKHEFGRCESGECCSIHE